MERAKAENIAEEIVRIYNEYGATGYAGERVSQLQHACQAAQFAEREGCDTDIILAAFLHDLGHLLEHDSEQEMEGFGTLDHEKLGADFLLERGFSDKIAALVESHVQAKRYLCYSNSRYYEQLSDASKMTLKFQGGPMTEAEAAEFEENPLKNLIIKLRSWDERAKVEGEPIPDINIYRGLIVEHLSS